MVTRLLIARHGNTFSTGEVPRRVGKNTDLPLVLSGILQAQRLGHYIKAKGIVLDEVVVSSLKRTQQTAFEIIKIVDSTLSIRVADRFTEIDYGPDENKREEDVRARIGAAALEAWDKSAMVPPGWRVDAQKIKKDWLDVGRECQNKTMLVVTSNGIARFAPCLVGDVERFQQTHTIKIATGALCVLEKENDQWLVKEWNKIPL